MSPLNWHQAIAHYAEAGAGYVIATVMGAAGSTPREPGTKMVITADHTHDTIGGGQLEFLVIQHARQLLSDGKNTVAMEAFPLAAQAQQCCGGHMSVMLECFAPCQWQLAVFGAGHVAQRLIPILAELPVQVYWCDERVELFPASLPANVSAKTYQDPLKAVRSLPTASDILILTHDHALDYALTQAALARSELGFVGLIGSNTKAQRFRKRLAHAGLAQEIIDHLQSPVGLSEIPGKRPMEVAVSIAGQLIAHYHANSEAKVTKRGLGWKEMKSALQHATVTVHD
ncbi:xanthine dehydrogenase accessory protein XdhC [Marinibactrum halimedae]|nr:xanthine dehydrogenase accessory protein XdhC [Marinibactrum halimedae]MCD9459670.1 xanthine dehydrogenase accessory protein XdhC [Marinibactrum halimedae]